MTTWTQPPDGWDPQTELAGTPHGDLLAHVERTGHRAYGVMTHLGHMTVWCGCGWPEKPSWWQRLLRWRP